MRSRKLTEKSFIMNRAWMIVLEELRGLFHQSPRPKLKRKLKIAAVVARLGGVGELARVVDRRGVPFEAIGVMVMVACATAS